MNEEAKSEECAEERAARSVVCREALLAGIDSLSSCGGIQSDRDSESVTRVNDQYTALSRMPVGSAFGLS